MHTYIIYALARSTRVVSNILYILHAVLVAVCTVLLGSGWCCPQQFVDNHLRRPNALRGCVVS